jgi:flotillin
MRNRLIARIEEEQQLEENRIALNQKRHEAEVVVPARADREAEEHKAAGRAAEIQENGTATAEVVRLMREQWAHGETRELFMLQQLPDIIDKMTRVVSDNLSIDKLTVLDGGTDNGGLPRLTRSTTGSVVSMMEELENATGLDIPELLGRERERPSSLGKCP